MPLNYFLKLDEVLRVGKLLGGSSLLERFDKVMDLSDRLLNVVSVTMNTSNIDRWHEDLTKLRHFGKILLQLHKAPEHDPKAILGLLLEQNLLPDSVSGLTEELKRAHDKINEYLKILKDGGNKLSESQLWLSGNVTAIGIALKNNSFSDAFSLFINMASQPDVLKEIEPILKANAPELSSSLRISGLVSKEMSLVDENAGQILGSIDLVQRLTRPQFLETLRDPSGPHSELTNGTLKMLEYTGSYLTPDTSTGKIINNMFEVIRGENDQTWRKFVLNSLNTLDYWQTGSFIFRKGLRLIGWKIVLASQLAYAAWNSDFINQLKDIDFKDIPKFAISSLNNALHNPDSPFNRALADIPVFGTTIRMTVQVLNSLVEKGLLGNDRWMEEVTQYIQQFGADNPMIIFFEQMTKIGLMIKLWQACRRGGQESDIESVQEKLAWMMEKFPQQRFRFLQQFVELIPLLRRIYDHSKELPAMQAGESVLGWGARLAALLNSQAGGDAGEVRKTQAMIAEKLLGFSFQAMEQSAEAALADDRPDKETRPEVPTMSVTEKGRKTPYGTFELAPAPVPNFSLPGFNFKQWQQSLNKSRESQPLLMEESTWREQQLDKKWQGLEKQLQAQVEAKVISAQSVLSYVTGEMNQRLREAGQSGAELLAAASQKSNRILQVAGDKVRTTATKTKERWDDLSYDQKAMVGLTAGGVAFGTGLGVAAYFMSGSSEEDFLQNITLENLEEARAEVNRELESVKRKRNIARGVTLASGVLSATLLGGRLALRTGNKIKDAITGVNKPANIRYEFGSAEEAREKEKAVQLARTRGLAQIVRAVPMGKDSLDCLNTNEEGKYVIYAGDNKQEEIERIRKETKEHENRWFKTTEKIGAALIVPAGIGGLLWWRYAKQENNLNRRRDVLMNRHLPLRIILINVTREISDLSTEYINNINSTSKTDKIEYDIFKLEEIASELIKQLAQPVTHDNTSDNYILGEDTLALPLRLFKREDGTFEVDKIMPRTGTPFVERQEDDEELTGMVSFSDIAEAKKNFDRALINFEKNLLKDRDDKSEVSDDFRTFSNTANALTKARRNLNNLILRKPESFLAANYINPWLEEEYGGRIGASKSISVEYTYKSSQTGDTLTVKETKQHSLAEVLSPGFEAWALYGGGRSVSNVEVKWGSDIPEKIKSAYLNRESIFDYDEANKILSKEVKVDDFKLETSALVSEAMNKLSDELTRNKKLARLSSPAVWIRSKINEVASKFRLNRTIDLKAEYSLSIDYYKEDGFFARNLDFKAGLPMSAANRRYGMTKTSSDTKKITILDYLFFKRSTHSGYEDSHGGKGEISGFSWPDYIKNTPGLIDALEGINFEEAYKAEVSNISSSDRDYYTDYARNEIIKLIDNYPYGKNKTQELLDGSKRVAKKMVIGVPKTLTTKLLRATPPGFIYRTINEAINNGGIDNPISGLDYFEVPGLLAIPADLKTGEQRMILVSLLKNKVKMFDRKNAPLVQQVIYNEETEGTEKNTAATNYFFTNDVEEFIKEHISIYYGEVDLVYATDAMLSRSALPQFSRGMIQRFVPAISFSKNTFSLEEISSYLMDSTFNKNAMDISASYVTSGEVFFKEIKEYLRSLSKTIAIALAAAGIVSGSSTMPLAAFFSAAAMVLVPEIINYFTADSLDIKHDAEAVLLAWFIGQAIGFLAGKLIDVGVQKLSSSTIGNTIKSAMENIIKSRAKSNFLQSAGGRTLQSNPLPSTSSSSAVIKSTSSGFSRNSGRVVSRKVSGSFGAGRQSKPIISQSRVELPSGGSIKVSPARKELPSGGPIRVSPARKELPSIGPIRVSSARKELSVNQVGTPVLSNARNELPQPAPDLNVATSLGAVINSSLSQSLSGILGTVYEAGIDDPVGDFIEDLLSGGEKKDEGEADEGEKDEEGERPVSSEDSEAFDPHLGENGLPGIKF
ncbi:hypothetical protein P8971_24985 [Serratia marcescens]|uniref:hypothetical protein n=1 Tax=Serratia marcescens TaxID=615 RepID=UPI00320470C6